MSALTEAGLFNLELRVRTEAERIRFCNPEADLTSPAVSSVAKVHVQNERDRADEFDQIGDIIAGLADDWEALGPKVRAGFVRQRNEYEASKEKPDTTTERAA